jgi:hypothetical protein
MKKLFFSTLLLTSGLLLAPMSQAAEWSGWPASGSAKLTWAFFDVYNSQLRTPSGKYQPNAWPQALIITYLRDISSKALTQATGDQWQALGLMDEANQHRWLTQVQKIWPDVKAGNEITFLADQQGGQFYFRADRTGTPAPLGPRFDRSFRDAFLAIWLSPSTQYPQLRQGLIGAR